MSKTISRLLVVDACVVRSAGETEHPISSASRKCLQDILHICHRVAITTEIKMEWDRHMSRFSRKWRRSMAARKKPLIAIRPGKITLDLGQFTPSAQKAIEKDRCYLEATIAAEHIIVTRDNALKTALGETKEGTNLIESLQWINPVEDNLSILKEL